LSTFSWILFGINCRAVSGNVSVSDVLNGASHAWNVIRYRDENNQVVELIVDATFASSSGPQNRDSFILMREASPDDDYDR